MYFFLTSLSISEFCKLLLVGHALQGLAQVREVPVVVNPEKQLGQVGRTLVVVPEVRKQLEDPAALLFEVGLDPKELVPERRILHVFFFHLAEESAELLAHDQHVLQRLQHLGVIQKELLNNGGKVLVVEDTNLFEIPACFDPGVEFAPLALQHIYLQVAVQVVNQEAHVHAQLHSLPEDWLLHQMLHASYLL